jgi:hypothetical protein
MTGFVRFACHAAVVAWIALYLAWRSADVPRVEAASSLRLLPAPVASSPPAPAAPRPVDVGGEEVARGEDLLAAGDGFPALSFSYQSFPSFRAYAASMEKLGARFVVVSRRAIVAGVDLEGGDLGNARLDAGFSPRARDYTAEPALAGVTGAARARFGDDAEVMLLMPRRVDAGLFGGIARALDERGPGHAGYSEVRGRYERAPDGGVRLHVLGAQRLDGAEEAFELVFDLAALAGGPT